MNPSLLLKVDLLAILPYFVSFVMEELKVDAEYDDDHINDDHHQTHNGDHHQI